MRRALGMAVGSIWILVASVALGTPPAPGQHFDCSDGGDSSCTLDDPGCVSNTAAHLKCSAKINKLLAKAIYLVAVCHEKQAKARLAGASETGAGISEENCEENPGHSAKGKVDAALAKLQDAGLCDPIQLTNAAAIEAMLFGVGADSLDAGNGSYYCDPTSATAIGDDDAGYVPATSASLKCSAAVARNVAKLIAAASKCHAKMNAAFFKGSDYDETVCEENDPVWYRSARDKYDRVRAKLVNAGICPACLDAAAQSQLADEALDRVDALVGDVFPCGLGP